MTTIEQLRLAGYLTPLDCRFAETLGRLVDARPEGLLAAAVSSPQMTQGHVCVDLAKPPIPVDADGEAIADVRWPGANAWISALKASALVSAGGEVPATPLVLDSAGRLYLQRLWCHQQE